MFAAFFLFHMFVVNTPMMGGGMDDTFLELAQKIDAILVMGGVGGVLMMSFLALAQMLMLPEWWVGCVGERGNNHLHACGCQNSSRLFARHIARFLLLLALVLNMPARASRSQEALWLCDVVAVSLSYVILSRVSDC